MVNTSAENKIILGVSLFLGFIFDYFFYAKVPGIAFPLYVFLIITGFFALAALFGKKINKEVFFLLIPLFFLSAMVFIRSSFLLTFLNIIASLLLLLLLAETFFW